MSQQQRSGLGVDQLVGRMLNGKFVVKATVLILSVATVLEQAHAFSSYTRQNQVSSFIHHRTSVSSLSLLHITRSSRSLRRPLFVSSTPPPIQEGKNTNKNSDGDNDDDIEDDATLLSTVGKEQLLSLCEQCNIELRNDEKSSSTKEELLQRLRDYAAEQAQLDQERRLRQVERIEMGVDDTQRNGKAKHKIVSEESFTTTGINTQDKEDTDDDGDDSLEGFFYFSAPDTNATSQQQQKTSNQSSKNSLPNTTLNPLPKRNEQGERVVTVYSTTDQNDLTGIMAAQSSSVTDLNEAARQSRTNDIGGSNGPENTLAGGPFGDVSNIQRRKASSKEMEQACEVLNELVQSLLAMTGAPGFQDEFMGGITFLGEENDGDSGDKVEVKSDAQSSTKLNFVGFNPGRVPTEMLTQASRAIRIGNGEALAQVCSEFEIQAIGLDGMNGDDKTKGGGHYLEVQKVQTFLDGFRKAEVRRVARETTTMLLDSLVKDGIKGLDQMLMGMTKGTDDSSDAGELNDSLVQYLEEAIRQQEQKVQTLKLSRDYIARSVHGEEQQNVQQTTSIKEQDKTAGLWDVATDEDGETVESLDPNDPRLREALKEELLDESGIITTPRDFSSVDPSEKLLILLTLLKERIKAEATFANDEKGQNLRLLAYCLHTAGGENERRKLIVDYIGSSLSRLESFSDLLQSSIDYAESTSHQLQPSKSAPLNRRLLISIKDLVDEIRESQAWKASGASGYNP